VPRGGNSPPGEMRGGVVPLYGAGHAGHVHHRPYQVQAQGKPSVYNILAVGTHLLMCCFFKSFICSENLMLFISCKQNFGTGYIGVTRLGVGWMLVL